MMGAINGRDQGLETCEQGHEAGDHSATNGHSVAKLQNFALGSNRFLGTGPLHLRRGSPIFTTSVTLSPAHTTMDFIDYRRLPQSSGGFTELFHDYIEGAPGLAPFFAYSFRDPAAPAAAAQAAADYPRDRGLLVEVLREQNTGFGSPPRTFESIASLASPTTVAVVTGQQVGLFGGPLYTVFKTITAIKLASLLKSKLPGRDVVPIFWLEGEDHDFAEMNATSVLDADNQPVRCEYLPGGEMPERNVGAVGEMTFDSSLASTFARLEQGLIRSEFTDGLLGMLKGSYREGRTFNQAFAAWMNILFEDHGLVFVSSNDPRFKKVLSPLFVREIQDFPTTSQLVITQSAELEKRFHAQIKAKSINLFFFHKGGRYLIEPRETDYSLRGTRHFIPKEELPRLAQEQPELFSTNVILRPIAQDTLLPTVAYIGGPSEIAYHAQLGPVYREFGIPQPVLYPRASASLIEERLRRAMEKYGLELVEFFEDANRVTAKVVEQISEVKLDQIFTSTAKRMHDSLSELRFGLKEVDPTLLAALEGVTSKIDINLGVLKEKAMAAQKRRNESAVRQIERAANGLLPNGGLQERELSVVHYINKYGPEAFRRVVSELDITALGHQILTV